MRACSLISAALSPTMGPPVSTSRKSAARKPVALDLSEWVARARHTLHEQGFIKVAALGPRPLRSAIIGQLRADGFEASKSTVRRPLAEQLRDALKNGTFIPLKTAHTFLVGGTALEAKKAALDLVRKGQAHLVLRTKSETLVPPTADVVDREEVRSARVVLAALLKRLQPLAKPTSQATLLRSDLQALLDEVPSTKPPHRGASTRGIGSAPKPAPASSDERLRHLFAAIEATRDERLGLSFVPNVVRRLAPDMDVETTHALLLDASRRELLELRPESGLGRLSQQDLRDCPPGPQGTRLSWARRL